MPEDCILFQKLTHVPSGQVSLNQFEALIKKLKFKINSHTPAVYKLSGK